MSVFSNEQVARRQFSGRKRLAPGSHSVSDLARHCPFLGLSFLVCEMKGLARMLSKELSLSSWGLRVFRICPEVSLCQTLVSVFMARGPRSAAAAGGVAGMRSCQSQGRGCVTLPGISLSLGGGSGLMVNTIHEMATAGEAASPSVPEALGQ